MSVVLCAFPTTAAEELLISYEARVLADGGELESAARGCALSTLLEIYGETIGYELDTTTDIDVALTFSIQDIQDPTKRRGAFSKTVTLPGTSTNNALFGHAYDLQSYFSGFNPTKRIRAALWVDGIQVFTGVMQLLKIKKQGVNISYEVSLYSDEISLFRDIDGKLLTDIDLSDLDHNYTSGVVSGTWGAPIGSGYVYPMYDGGDYLDRVVSGSSALANTFGVESFKPAVYVKEYIDRIFSAAGYRYSSAFFESDRFKSLAIPYAANGQVFITVAQASGQAARVRASTDSTGTFIQFDDDTTTGFYNNGGNFNTGTSTYEAPGTGLYQVVIRGTLFNDSGATHTAQVGVYKNDVLITASPQFTILSLVGAQLNFTSHIQLAQNDVIDFRLIKTGGVEFQAGGWVLITPASSMFVDTLMDMNNAIPVNVKQSDLISDLIKMFNLMMYADPADPKLLYIEPWVNFYASGVVDWSDKVDQSADFDIQAGDPESRKTYNFSYSDGADLFNKKYKEEFNTGYGSRQYIIDSFYAKNTVEVKTTCIPCVPAQYNTDRVIFRAFDLDNNGNAKAVTTGYRIGQYKFVEPPSGTFWIYEGVNQTVGYPYIGHIDNPYAPTFDLSFGIPKKVYYNALTASGTTTYTNNNLFNIYWKNYVDELISPETMQAELTVILSPVDIQSLDFRKIIYIHGTYWRLIEVRDYVAGKQEPCRVLLRRVLNSLPFTGNNFNVSAGYTNVPRDGEQVPTIQASFTTTT